MAINVVVNGAKGRMGQESVKAILSDPELKLVGQADMGDDLLVMVKEKQADVVVDFTVASVVAENLQKIIEAGVRPVVGTSGLVECQVEELKQMAKAKNLGGIIAPNFAIGAVLMMKYAADAAKYMPQVEVIEYHHDRKEDSPSGTAVKTAEMIAKTRANFEPPCKGKETIAGARGAFHENVPVHSVRIPGVIANQEVIFGGLGQTLTIRHDSLNRESFMPGVRLACKKVMELDELVYGLENVL